jgi:NADPH2:quinone reductase
LQAWVVDRLVPEGEMRLAEVAPPSPVGDQCLLRVEAAGVNFLDTLMIRGLYQVRPPLPFTPGVEVAGTVVGIGRESPYVVGDRLCAMVEYGGFAEFAIVPLLGSERLPPDIPVRQAVALPITYPTAYLALCERAGLKHGETVLIHAGAGGVGSAAIQLARHWGARVIATAGSAEKTALCLELGADVAINYSIEPILEAVRAATGGRGVDVVVDPVGGQTAIESLRCLAWGGRLVIVGFAGGSIAQLSTNRLLLKNAAALGVYWGGFRRHNPAVGEKVCADIFRLYREGIIKPLVRDVFPFLDAKRALEALAARRTCGKVALLVQAGGKGS